MALTQYDVLMTLSDTVLQRMDFTVDSMHITGDAFRKVFELVRDEQIPIIAGDDPDSAEYNPTADTLTTQAASAPLDLFNRSMLIHECTHAIKDVYFVTITALGNEAAAYLTQALYLVLSQPHPVLPTGWDHVQLAIDLVKKLKLDQSPGAGMKIEYDDIVPLVKRIGTIAAYQKDRGRLAVANGISAKPRRFIDAPDTDPPPSTKGQDTSTVAHRVPSDALFATDRADITPGAEGALRLAGEYIQQFLGPGDRVYITGHTDNTGDAAYNMVLSKRRAEAVKQWLVRNNLADPARVSTDGRGATKPIAPNSNETGRSLNRRVEILIM